MSTELPEGQSSQLSSKKHLKLKNLCFANTKPPWFPTYRIVHMIVILLVHLPSVAFWREAADAALGPAANKSYLLLVWSPLPWIRNTASIPAKEGLSHLF